jgi:hypothetical protein
MTGIDEAAKEKFYRELRTDDGVSSRSLIARVAYEAALMA